MTSSVLVANPYDPAKVQISLAGVELHGLGKSKFKHNLTANLPQVTLGISSPSLAYVDGLKGQKLKLLVQYKQNDESTIVFFDGYVKFLRYSLPEGLSVEYPYVDVVFAPVAGN